MVKECFDFLFGQVYLTVHRAHCVQEMHWTRTLKSGKTFWRVELGSQWDRCLLSVHFYAKLFLLLKRVWISIS